MLLALASGTTISMAQLATTLYALALGVDSARLGIIAAMEPLGIALMTLPAGLLVARWRAARVLRREHGADAAQSRRAVYRRMVADRAHAR